MIEREVSIGNDQGIHCRPAAAILKETKGYEGKIRIIAESGETNLVSVMSLLSLGLEHGRKITIQVDGPDEEKMADKLVELFEYNFDFPPRE